MIFVFPLLLILLVVIVVINDTWSVPNGKMYWLRSDCTTLADIVPIILTLPAILTVLLLIPILFYPYNCKELLSELILLAPFVPEKIILVFVGKITLP